VALEGGLVGLALAGAGDGTLEVGARLAAVALVSLVAALVLGWSSLIPVSLVLLGAAYATRLAVDDAPVDTKAPLFAAGLFLAAELAYWSLDERIAAKADAGEDLRRAAVVAALGLGALAAAGAVLAAADVAQARGLAVDVLGALAATAALLVVLLVARRES
jgi:hypothetical protein